MQILRTEIAHTITSNGDPVVRVSFCGEGGDCVTVDMAQVEPQTEDGAFLDRARAILVQTATFDLAANDYDARSNGKFDEVAITVAHGSDGAIYVYEYRDGQSSRKIPPTRMPSADAARSEAVRSAVDLLTDLEPGMDDLTGWLVRVWDERGDLLWVIDADEAEAARRAAVE